MLLSVVLMLHFPLQQEEPAVRQQPAAPMHYRGELLRREPDGFSPLDDFEITRIPGSGNEPAGYVLLQSGVDRARWPACIGRSVPRIQHTHDGVPYRLELLPLQISGDLSEGRTWTNGRRTYRIVGSTRHQGRDCAELVVNEGPARNHKLLVEKRTGAAVLLEQRIFMGRGDEFRLTLQTRDLPGEQPADAAVFEQLLKLRSRIDAQDEKPHAPLSEKQLEAVAAAAPELRKAASANWAKKFMSRLEKDTNEQQSRTRKLADLKKDGLGRPLPGFQLRTIGGKALDSKDLSGQIAVLHFWKYRDDPLSEPYGQTAYLDFLSGRNSGKPVRVVGINVDTRYADQTQARKANRSAGKLAEFMNLSYDIVGDDGSLLKKLGDPRSAGAQLPLWVVVDKGGVVRVWKDGFYKVDPRKGLTELQQALDKLLK